MMLLLILLGGLATSFAVGWFLVRFERLHAHLSYDLAASGPQKMHSRPTPRIGGVPIAAGFLVSTGLAAWQGLVSGPFLLAFGLSVLPAFASGLLEDITKKLGPDIRLWAAFLSALTAIFWFDAVVDRCGLPYLDALLTWYPLALLFTVVGVGGVAHAVNIIDGCNGLAGMTTCMMLAAFGYVSWQLGDTELLVVCIALGAGTLGFLLWNFPDGRIFAGDGGAYLWGVSVAIVGVILIHRHPGVSPWFPLAVVIYPVFETLFSVYRRKIKQSAAAGLPDAKHLHQLIYRRLLSAGRDEPRCAATAAAHRNAATSPFLWALAATSIVPAAFFYEDTSTLIGLTAVFCLLYVWLYRVIVRFGSPAWLRRAARWASDVAAAHHARKPA